MSVSEQTPKTCRLLLCSRVLCGTAKQGENPKTRGFWQMGLRSTEQEGHHRRNQPHHHRRHLFGFKRRTGNLQQPSPAAACQQKEGKQTSPTEPAVGLIGTTKNNTTQHNAAALSDKQDLLLLHLGSFPFSFFLSHYTQAHSDCPHTEVGRRLPHRPTGFCACLSVAVCIHNPIYLSIYPSIHTQTQTHRKN